MSDDEFRQIVKIRHELRRLPVGDQDGATRLLERMRALTEVDVRERAALEPELQRWRVAFRLDPDRPRLGLHPR